jgi:glutathione S-transferase
MKLFFRPLACSLACRIAALEAKLDVEFVEVNLFGDHITASGQSFQELFPKGKVAALLLDDGRILTENAAILQFIGDQAEPSTLVPVPASADRYRVQEALSFVGTELHKGILYPLFQPQTPDEVKEHVRSLAPRILDQLDHMLQDATWITGDDFTVADCYLIWTIYLLKLSEFDLSENIIAYYKRAKNRASVEQALGAEFALYQRQIKAA